MVYVRLVDSPSEPVSSLILEGVGDGILLTQQLALDLTRVATHPLPLLLPLTTVAKGRVSLIHAPSQFVWFAGDRRGKVFGFPLRMCCNDDISIGGWGIP